MGENDQVCDLSVCLFSITKTNKRMIRLFLKNKSFFAKLPNFFVTKQRFHPCHIYLRFLAIDTDDFIEI